VSLPRWRVRASDGGQAARLAAEVRLRPLTARILAARGLGDPAPAARFLAPCLGDLSAPGGLLDLEPACERLVGAVARGERVGVFGDHDADGVTTAAVLTLTLRALGADVIARVADHPGARGLTPDAAAALADAGCAVVIAGDCGTGDHQALSLCAERAIDTIVVDHHPVPEGGSRARWLINPHRPDDHSGLRGLASCGLAFTLARALDQRLPGRFDPSALLDLVALGTLADQVPLVGDNRILVALGLRALAALARPGLRALAAVAEGTGPLTVRLQPRLAAAGRLGRAPVALDLLLAGDEATARPLARELDDLNGRRQRLQEAVWGEALAAATAEAEAGAAALVVAGEGWHPGVPGPVAARLLERFQRPALVIGLADGQGRGSARSAAGVDLPRVLEACRAHLLAFGGHPGAAGVTLAREQLAPFRAAFLRAVPPLAAAEAIEVDAEAELGELGLGQVEELGRLAPFGAANNEPLLAIPGVVARATRVVAGNNLLLTLGRGPATAEAVAFGMGHRDPGAGAALAIIATAEVDTFRGTRRPRLRVRQLLRSNS
jgi:single-stranded-DNA-specific exonuclease